MRRRQLADLLVLRLPIFLLTSLGTIHGGLACLTVPDLEARRYHSATHDAAIGHDDCDFEWSEGGNVQVS
jgi:hypothetical protein